MDRSQAMRTFDGAPGGAPSFVAVDWGTTTFRAYLATAAGDSLAMVQTDRGILSVRDRRFELALAEAIAPWLREHGNLPVLMSGMIGSRQGWRDVRYAACPARLADFARSIATVEAGSFGGVGPLRVGIVAGMAVTGDGRLPDVMRGEETQVLGALARLRLADGTFVLPGTHAKWVTVVDGAITAFRTYMTGEVFAALKGHTILGRLMSGEGGTGGGFQRGLETARGSDGGPGRFLHLIFSARSRGLMGEIAECDLADYLSGLLVGAEIADAAVGARRVAIIADAVLADRYRIACAHFGLEATVAPADCAVAGLAAIANAAGWIKGARS